MNVAFRKIGQLPVDFDLHSGNMSFTGTLSSLKRFLIKLDATLQGETSVDCDVCAESFMLPIDEKIELLLSDGVYKDDDSIFDIVEIEKSIINMDEIFHSELELIRSDYHRCKACQN